MSYDQLFMGVAVAALCLMGLCHQQWLLTHTKKGQWLVERFGEQRALWVLRGLLLAGMVFGGLLAAEIVNPIRW